MIKYIVVFFIFIRHGINPFTPLGKNGSKIKNRLTSKEKEYVIASHKDDYTKNWLRKLICEDKCTDF